MTAASSQGKFIWIVCVLCVFVLTTHMDSMCDIYTCADDSSVLSAENAVFILRMRLRRCPRSVDLGDFGVF